MTSLDLEGRENDNLTFSQRISQLVAFGVFPIFAVISLYLLFCDPLGLPTLQEIFKPQTIFLSPAEMGPGYADWKIQIAYRSVLFAGDQSTINYSVIIPENQRGVDSPGNYPVYALVDVAPTKVVNPSSGQVLIEIPRVSGRGFASYSFGVDEVPSNGKLIGTLVVNSRFVTNAESTPIAQRPISIKIVPIYLPVLMFLLSGIGAWFTGVDLFLKFVGKQLAQLAGGKRKA